MLVDLSGVTSYDFLATGGTSGTGGEGPHTVGGYSFTLDFNGTAGPTSLTVDNGVIKPRGVSLSGNHAYLILDVGADVDTVPHVMYLSAENLDPSAGQSFIFRVGEHNTVGVLDDTLGALWGYDGVADDTSVLVREANSAVAFTTIQQVTGLTDTTTTATRFAYHWLGGAAMVSYDQGTAALLSSGAALGTVLSSNLGVGMGATTRQNRRYAHFFMVEDVDVRYSAYYLKVTP